MAEEKIAVVTGGNRGIGLEVCRQLAQKGYRVVLTARNADAAKKEADALAKQGLAVESHQLDVSDSKSVEKLASSVEKKHGRLDALVNNAGVLLDRQAEDVSVFSVPEEIVRTTFEVNTLGVFRTCRALIPLIKKGKRGRIVNVSSGMGQLSEMNGGYPGYRLSKAALNALTRILADELKGTGILVNSVCPGWVKTDMGGPNAERTVEQGAAGIVWAATLPDDGPQGGFFRDAQPLDW